MSPSAVSQQLSLLERETKVTLFEQAGRRVVVTDAGVRLARRAEEMLGLLESAEAELQEAQGDVGGVLRVASFQTPLIALAPSAVSVLEERHPQLRIELAQREVEGAYEGLLAHRFEVILGEDYPGGQRVVRRGTDREGLLRDPMLLVLPDTGPWVEGTRPSRTSPRPRGHWIPRVPAPGSGSAPTCAPPASSRGSASTPRTRCCRCTSCVPGMRSPSSRGSSPPSISAARGRCACPGTRTAPSTPRRRAGAASHPALLAFRAAMVEAAGTLSDLHGLDRLGE